MNRVPVLADSRNKIQPPKTAIANARTSTRSSTSDFTSCVPSTGSQPLSSRTWYRVPRNPSCSTSEACSEERSQGEEQGDDREDERYRFSRGEGDHLPFVPKMGIIVPRMGTKPTTASLGSALFGKTRLAILALLYGQVDRTFYLSEIVRLAGVGRGAVQRELARLTRVGLLTRTELGQQVHFQANAEAPVFDELRGLVRKTAGIVDLLRLALSPLAERIKSAYVYGSIARGEETATSDIDLLVVGDVSLFDIVSATADIRDTLGRDLNPTVFPLAEYAEKVREKDHFLTTVLAGAKLYVIGGDDEPE